MNTKTNAVVCEMAVIHRSGRVGSRVIFKAKSVGRVACHLILSHLFVDYFSLFVFLLLPLDDGNNTVGVAL